MAESRPMYPGGTTGAAQSARAPKESLQKQVHRVHAFLDTVKTNKVALDANASERLHQGLENIDLYEETIADFENRLQTCDESKGDELEMEWAQKVKSMCDSGLDAVIAVMKRATASAKTE